MELQPIKIEPYNLSWTDQFNQEAELIKENCSEETAAIHHIGSTSIPKMAAKPIIDILIELKNIDDVNVLGQKLENVGYAKLCRNIIRHYSFFTFKTKNSIRFHCHIFEKFDPQVKRHLRFRDYLTSHPEEARRYQELKEQLAQSCIDDRLKYVLGKEDFVRTIDREAKHWASQEFTEDGLTPQRMNFITAFDKPKINRSIEANFIFRMTYYPQFLRSVIFNRNPKYISVLTSFPSDKLNFILDINIMDNALDEISDLNKLSNTQNKSVTWYISKFDKPNNLPVLLKGAGLKLSHPISFKIVDIKRIKSSQIKFLRIERISTINTWKSFIEILASESSELGAYYKSIWEIYSKDDPIEFFLGYSNEQPVAIGMIVYYAGLAGIYLVKTIQSAQKEHYEYEMRTLLFEEAKKAGAKFVCVESTNAPDFSLVTFVNDAK